jgi:uncharacterized protein with HEPN domain
VQHRNWRLRIEDMLEAIQHVQQYIQGFDLQAFCADQKTIDAVIRNFEVLGEAARHVPDEIQNKYPEIPWSKIRGMRHLLTHEYFGINTEIMWKTANQDLSPLIPFLQRILESDSI